jgi:hypothetical protein
MSPTQLDLIEAGSGLARLFFAAAHWRMGDAASSPANSSSVILADAEFVIASSRN